jgi:uncharacterized protein (UPF0332 family)
LEKKLKEKISALLKRSKEAQKEMEILLEEGTYSGAISRGYYSMFYLVSALLLTKKLEFSKHSGAISAFGQNFVKTGLVEEEYHRILQDAFEMRQRADYSYLLKIDKRTAVRFAESVRTFNKRISSHLRSLP